MKKIKKTIILVFCILFLGAQAFVIFVPYSFIWGDDWKIKDKPFWPFMRYPMYANGKKPGDKFSLSELRVNTANATVKVRFDDLHIKYYKLNALKWSVIKVTDSTYNPKPTDYKNLIYLNHLIKKYISKEAKTGQFWDKIYRISPEGVTNFDSDWELITSWDISDFSAFSAQTEMGGK